VEVENNQSRAPLRGLPIIQKLPDLSQPTDAGKQRFQQTLSSKSLDVTTSCPVATQYFILISDFPKQNKLLTIFFRIGKMVNKQKDYFQQ